MKHLITLAALLLLAIGSSLAQTLPNGDFEDENPGEGWHTLNASFESSYKVKLQGGGEQTIYPASGKKMAVLVVADDTTGILLQKFAWNKRSKSLRFKFGYLPAGPGDFCVVGVQLIKYNTSPTPNDTLVSVGTLFGESSPWQDGTVDIESRYMKEGLPDSARVFIYTSIAKPVNGSTMFIDDLRFSDFAVSTNDLAKQKTFDATIYPNPVGHHATIEYSTTQNGPTKISISDINGAQVKEILNETQSVGKHQIGFAVSDLSPAVYFCTIKTEEYTVVKRFVVTR